MTTEDDLRRQLKSLGEHLDERARAVDPADVMTRGRSAPVRSRRWALVGALSALALVVAGVVLALDRDDAPPGPVHTVGGTGTTQPADPPRDYEGTAFEDLPASGIAVLRDGGVVLVSLAGEELGRIRSSDLANSSVLPGTLELTPTMELRIREEPTVEAPDGCEQARQAAGVTVALCGGESQRRPQVMEVTSSGLTPLAGTPPGEITGRWWYALPSPDGKTILAQWLGECEAPSAWLISIETGELMSANREGNPASAPESRALGWAASGEAVVEMAPALCGSGSERPGVYLVSPDTGEATFVTREASATSEAPPESAYLWHRSSASEEHTTLTLDFGALGPIRLGMTIEQAEQASGANLLEVEALDNGCVSYEIPGQAAFIAQDGSHIRAIIVTSPAVRTVRGVGVSDPYGAVVAAYDDLEPDVHPDRAKHVLVTVLTVPVNAPDLQLLFQATPDGTIESVRTGYAYEAEVLDECLSFEQMEEELRG